MRCSKSHYTEASLIKALEKEGIGRPSTYQEIITNIQERGYVRSESKRLYATKIANLISDRLYKSFNRVMDYGFTAEMEKSLDEVAEGKEDWKKLLETLRKLHSHIKEFQIYQVSKTINIFWG